MPMMPDLKICGLTCIEEIGWVNQYPISYAGFIFAKESRRFVSVELAKKLRDSCNPNVKTVGVFTHTKIEEVNEIAKEVGLDLIQLHSDETNLDCKKAVRPVWKMISMKDQASIDQAKAFPDAAGILLDTYHKDMLGGSGDKFCWEDALGMSERYFLILAGGLNAENILEAAKLNPAVLDINSGVETNGKKDKEKIKELVRRFQYGIQ